jgi:hypothetical protein
VSEPAEAARAVQAGRRIPPELWLGVLAVLVCAGALLGPGLYRRLVVGRMARDAGDSLTTADRDALRALMDLDWPESDEALSRLARRSPQAAYLPEHKAIVSVSEWRKFDLAAPGGGFFNVRVLECYLHSGRSFSGKLVGARVMGFAAEGPQLRVNFLLDDPVSDRLGLKRGDELATALTLAELRRAVGSGEAVMVDYDAKSADTVWQQVLEGLEPLLEGAGVDLP